MAAINEQDILSEFKLAQKQRLVLMMRERVYNAGDVICKQGEKLNEFIIIRSGLASEFDNGKSIITHGDSDALSVSMVGTHKAGECIGTLSLFRSLISSTEIVAKTVLSCWYVDGGLFRLQTYENNQKEMLDNVSILKTVSIFESMDTNQLQRVVNTMTVASYDDGQYIIRKGEEGTKFFIIKKGEAVVFAGDVTI